MKALIITASSDKINQKYLDIADKVSNFLAENDFDLVFGASSKSMMGICYENFKNHKRTIYSLTTPKYQDQLAILKDSKHYLYETTFDLKKALFDNADIVICLPGGVGTYSEVLSFIEEKRSNDNDKPIIIYNENNFYKDIISIIDNLIKENFTSHDIYNSFTIINNFEEFKNEILRRK